MNKKLRAKEEFKLKLQQFIFDVKLDEEPNVKLSNDDIIDVLFSMIDDKLE